MAATPQGNVTRQRLVNAATRAFAERGYRAASLDSVAAEAGVTRQSLLHYFPSKTDLLMAVLDQRDADDRAFSKQLNKKRGMDLADALLSILRRNQEHPRIAQLFALSTAESVVPDHPAHEYFRERHERVLRELAGGVVAEQERGNVRADLDPEAVAVIFLALLNGLNVQRLLRPDVDLEATLSSMIRALFNSPESLDCTQAS